MVGALTVLVTAVATFLAYNATNGLPFVPVYRVSADLPNAQRLTPNNEVRIAGRRVGIVEEVRPVRARGRAIARASLKLERDLEPLPAGTRVRVRYSSAFGLKYVELVPPPPAASTETVPEGGVIPLRQASLSTEFDDIGNTFDRRTREAVRTALVGFGGALAGRGSDLNDSIATLDPLMLHLAPVAAELAAPATGLRRLLRELGDAARIVAPVATETSQLFRGASRTFAALAADPAALQAAIAEGVPTLEQGTRALAATRPFLGQAAALAVELRPAAARLDAALPPLNRALLAGARTLPAVPRLAAGLAEVLDRVDALVAEPQAETAILRLRDAFTSADRAAAHLVPIQTMCNYWLYWFTNFPNGHSEPTNVGTTQRDIIVFPPGGMVPPNDWYGPDDVPMAPLADYAGVQANGRRTTAPVVPNPGIFDPRTQPIFHGGAYAPDVVADDGSANCIGGQTGYPLGEFLAPGQDPSNPTFASVPEDYKAGTTFTGRERLP